MHKIPFVSSVTAILVMMAVQADHSNFAGE